MGSITLDRPRGKLPGFDAVARAAEGRWYEILVALGIPAEALVNRGVPCPGCGGTDRFRFDDKDGRGRWICSQGGNGLIADDGFGLLRHVYGWSPAEALAAVAHYLGMDTAQTLPAAPPAPRPAPPPPPKRDTQALALAIWSRAEKAREDRLIAAHPYAKLKGTTHAAGAGLATVSGSVVGQQAHCIVVPVRRHGIGEVVAVQVINGAGDKQTFGPSRAGYLLLGNDLDKSAPWFVAEGWASAVSAVFHHNRGRACCAVTFGEGRLDAVAQLVAGHYAPARLTLLEEPLKP